MNILNSASPEILRQAILKYIDWVVGSERRAAVSAITRRDAGRAKRAADVLEKVRNDIASAILAPLEPTV